MLGFWSMPGPGPPTVLDFQFGVTSLGRPGLRLVLLHAFHGHVSVMLHDSNPPIKAAGGQLAGAWHGSYQLCEGRLEDLHPPAGHLLHGMGWRWPWLHWLRK